MKTTLISKVAVPKMSSVYDDNFSYKTISACSNSQLRDKTLTMKSTWKVHNPRVIILLMCS